jgi:4-amino-4-deoxy-L-arabinose transferase-like glycosyltransferase
MRLSRKEIVFLVVIIAVSSFLRLYRLDEFPIGLCADTAYKGVSANRILAGEYPIFFAENWGGVEPMYMYITAVFMYFLGATPLVLKLVSAVLGIVTVPLLYLLARDLLNSKTIGALSSSFLAISYWHLNYSRLGWEIVLVPLFVIVTIHLLWRALRSGRWVDYLCAGVSLGASLYTYQAARALPILVVLYLLLRGLIDRRFFRDNGVKILFTLLVALLVFAPLASFFVTHPDSLFRRADNVSILNPELNQGSALRAFVTSVAKTAAMFQLLPDPNWRHNPAQRTILDPISGLLCLLGLGVTVLRFRKPQYLLILVWLFAMALPAVLTASGLPHSSRSIGLLPATCILSAIGLYEAGAWVKKRRPSTAIMRLTVLVTVLLLLVVAISTYVDYFTVWGNDELALAFDVPFVEAAEVMNDLTRPGGVWVLPLTSLADPVSVHDTIEFLYRGEAPHAFLSTDEASIAEELASVTERYQEVWVVEWDSAALGGAYLYHADPKGVLPFLLDKYGTQLDKEEFHAFDVLRYQLSPDPHFAIADYFQATSVSFADQISLTGVAFGGSLQEESSSLADVNEPLLASGQDAWVTLQWQALKAPGADYKAAVYLVDSRGRVLAQMDKVLLSNELEMTSRWQPGQVELDYYTLVTPPATPPGEYFLEVAVYDAETMARLPVLDEEGKIAGQSERVGFLQVVRSGVPARVQPQSPVSAGDLAPGVRLLGYDLPQREVEPGGVLRLALYWEALTDVDTDYTLSLELRDEEGRVQVRQTERPVDGTYPTTEWREGEVLRDWHDLALPPEAPEGEYELSLTVLDGESIQGQASLGAISVKGRPHYFAVTEIQYPLQISVGNNIRLLGYDLGETQVQAGGVLPLTLYWQAMGTTETSYTVFTHLLDPQSQVRGQQDSVPGGGALPTTSWIDGEVITDPYDLTVDADAPPGDYVLEIGMYDAATGERLPVYDAAGTPLGDRLLLPSSVVVQ